MLTGYRINTLTSTHQKIRHTTNESALKLFTSILSAENNKEIRKKENNSSQSLHY